MLKPNSTFSPADPNIPIANITRGEYFFAGNAPRGIEIKERAFAVGGTLRVESQPGRGARVRLELPALEDRNG